MMTNDKEEKHPRRRRRPAPSSGTARKRELSPQPESLRKVLATPELVEAILLQVDRRLLLTSAQRVCTSWHDIIATSPSLQRYLFFLASPATKTASPSAPKTEFTPNPLLRDAFPCLYPNPNRMYPAWQEILGIVPSGVGFVTAGEHNAGNWPDPDEIFPMTDTRFHGELRVVERSDAEALPWKMVEFPGGLRMGELFDEVFTMNWSRNRGCAAGGCEYSCHGDAAHIAWRVPVEMVTARPSPMQWYRTRWGSDPVPAAPTRGVRQPDWLAGADLVLGEDWWYEQKTRCSHPDWKDGMGPRCFLWQQGYWNDSPHTSWKRRRRWHPVGGRGMKWLFRCKDYKPRGPLSLPPLDGKR
ncbi:hypothetical protein B0T16DRAFT_227119 [Cercophora newfieldiana]|uniref:F-box domain-containing protein n=1 Tax=Cercophora newfieldiana TaxID=92897 RepID=A0AA39XQW6_9PEZI|nr:hypothetical protein B0T16DRAFT_227119 [Cercophora newfieldiana]